MRRIILLSMIMAVLSTCIFAQGLDTIHLYPPDLNIRPGQMIILAQSVG